MKKVIYITRICMGLLFTAAFLTSCNNGSEASPKEEEKSFMDDMFESESSEDLSITAADISSSLSSVSEQEGFLKPEALTAFYESRENSPAWNKAALRDEFYEQLKRAEEEGLSAEAYHGARLQEMMADPGGLSTEEQANLDLLLSDAFMAYAEDLLYGVLDPEEMYRFWGVEREQEDISGILQQAVDQEKVATALNELKPDQQVYADLKKALQEYEALKETDTVSIIRIEEGSLIEPGEQDERITTIADRLKQLEVLDPEYDSRENIYDEVLQSAVREFQEKTGLMVDGKLGNSTIGQLNMGPEDRYNQILANLERWRWYPRDLGEHYILINIPAFKLAVVKEGDTVRTHDVIAGTKQRQTPVFSDTLQYIVLNPEWTIPPTIKSQDVIPAASQDPSYLPNNNIAVFSADGEEIDPSGIDWSSEEVTNYNYVQQAGPTNPLGQVKIIYPNDYLIYLHDTPAQGLFEQNERAESSGCVRVENAIDLSAYVVNEQEDWDLERIQETISRGRTTQVAIKNPIQVHHFYWTAWRDDKGKTVFTQDVYDLDREIYTALLEN